MDTSTQIYRFNGSDEDRESLITWIVSTTRESGLAGMGYAGARWVAAQMEAGDLLVTLDGAHFQRYREVPMFAEEEVVVETGEDVETEIKAEPLRDDTGLRIEALKAAMAATQQPSVAEGVISKAENFLAFLKGESE